MMRRTIGIAIALALSAAPALPQDRAFKLQLGDQTVEIDAGETVDVTLPDGSKAKATLTRNAFATFSSDKFSFVHPSGLNVSRSDLGDGVVQYLMATAIGSMVIIQTYDDIDPSSLSPLMLKELTEDEVAAGAKVEQAPATKQVDGKTLTGLTATETLKDDISTYEIFAHSNGDSGVLIITGLDRDNVAEDGPKIEKFWQTLKID